jgi:hypothetical protein
MAFIVKAFEETPNPNAIKCLLDRPISDRPRSFLNAAAAEHDALARRLFREAGATSVLMNGDWVTVNKLPDAEWSSVKRAVKRILAEADGARRP